MTPTTVDTFTPISQSHVSETDKRVLLLKPRGFCAGVVRAIDIVKIALETFGAPIYVRKEIVHNRFVVNELADKGAIFVDDIDQVPSDTLTAAWPCTTALTPMWRRSPRYR